MKSLIIAIVTVAVCCLLPGCKTAAKQTSAVPYREVRNYFVRNDAPALPSAPIRSQEEFDRYFGAAAFMGEGGKPTEVDYAKECVVAIDHRSTDRETEIRPVSLVRNADGKTVFTYRVSVGRKNSYYTHPCLIVAVPKDCAFGQLLLVEEK